MRAIRWGCFPIFIWAGALALDAFPEGVISGVVVDEQGAPVVNAAVLYSTVPKITKGPDGWHVASGPSIGARVKTGLPAATYHICVYGVKDTHLGTCEWQGTTRADLPAGQTVQLRFQIGEGTTLTFHVQDLRGQIRDQADLYTSNGKLPLSGSNFGIGVWAGNRYMLATPVSKGNAIRQYRVVIPKTVTVRLYLDTSLTVQDRTGAALPVRAQSIALAGGPQGEIVTNLVVP